MLLCRAITGGDEEATERSELLKLRVSVRMHESEMERANAQIADVSAKLSGVDQALRAATG